MNQRDGEIAMGIARAAAAAEAEGREYVLPQDLPPEFSRESGAFVTILENPSRGLRACIGYPAPIMPLGEAIAMSAIGAVHDPRFPTLTPREAAECLFEVTVLTPPEEVHYSSHEELKASIVIGRDGLMIEHMGRRGLFLPQVPVEQGWDIDEYLGHICLKAGLRYNDWKAGRPVLYTFRGEIFDENPDGTVARREQRCPSS